MRFASLAFFCLVALFVAFPALAQQATTEGQSYTGASNYVAVWPDSIATAAATTGPGTTVVITGASNKSIYVFFLGAFSTGTEGTNTTVNWIWGTGAACAGGTTGTLFPTPIFVPNFTNPGFIFGWSGTGISNPGSSSNQSGIVPTAVPLVIPVGDNVCYVVAGTTVAVSEESVYALR